MAFSITLVLRSQSRCCMMGRHGSSSLAFNPLYEVHPSLAPKSEMVTNSVHAPIHATLHIFMPRCTVLAMHVSIMLQQTVQVRFVWHLVPECVRTSFPPGCMLHRADATSVLNTSLIAWSLPFCFGYASFLRCPGFSFDSMKEGLGSTRCVFHFGFAWCVRAREHRSERAHPPAPVKYVCCGGVSYRAVVVFFGDLLRRRSCTCRFSTGMFRPATYPG